MSLARSVRREHYMEGFHWLAYAVFPGGFAFWGAMLLVAPLISKTLTFTAIAGKGELAMYGAGIVASVMPLVGLAQRPRPLSKTLLISAVTHLLASGAVYCVGVLVSMDSGFGPIDQSAMKVVSVVLLLVGLLIGFAATVLDSAFPGAPLDETKAQEKRLHDEFVQRRDASGGNT